MGGQLIQSGCFDSHGKQNLEHTTVRVLGSNLLVSKLNKLCVYLAILFQMCFGQELGIGNWLVSSRKLVM